MHMLSDVTFQNDFEWLSDLFSDSHIPIAYLYDMYTILLFDKREDFSFQPIFM